ncbi:MAG: sensor domain-containing protein [Candidatus Woesearchaeota archaeon]
MVLSTPLFAKSISVILAVFLGIVTYSITFSFENFFVQSLMIILELFIISSIFFFILGFFSTLGAQMVELLAIRGQFSSLIKKIVAAIILIPAWIIGAVCSFYILDIVEIYAGVYRIGAYLLIVFLFNVFYAAHQLSKGKRHTVLGHFFRVVVLPQTYFDLYYLFTAFTRSLFYALIFVNLLVIASVLSVVLLGFPFLLGLGYIWWWLILLERRNAHLLLGIKFKPIPKIRKRTLKKRLYAHLSRSITWKGLLYLVLKFPISVLPFTVIAGLFTLAVTILLQPLLQTLTVYEAAGYILLASIIIIITLHIVRFLIKLHKGIVLRLLGI